MTIDETVKKHDKRVSGAKALLLAGSIAAITGMGAVATKANADTATAESALFRIFADYQTDGAQFDISYKDTAPNDSDLFGKQVKFSLYNGGNVSSLSDDWTSTSSNNPNGSTNYQFNSQSNDANIQLYNSFKTRANFNSPLSDMTMTGLLTISIDKALGKEYVYLAAPLQLTQQQTPPTPVPDPATGLLLGSGLSALAYFRRNVFFERK